ncbi:hypothetical protein Nepgr_029783 [Nepenthes gracilis]|uniref:Uncharacterized protein n=1 Tax=Nepenthes gracilis TaxID=150966 RepID=A0AAD3TEB0_NEPGR|nr:hypothetical protein Nepgr_029783 [Nepenthes gracilis]
MVAKKSKEVLSKGGANVSAKQLAVKVLSIKDIASMMDLQVVAMHENVVTTSSLATPRSVLNMQDLQVTAAPPPI